MHAEVKANISVKINKNRDQITFPQIKKKVCNFFLYLNVYYHILIGGKITSLENNLKNKQPSNIEAEQSLIGSVLVNNDIIDEISNYKSINLL